MNSKQTDNNQQKKAMPDDWSPVSSVGEKTKAAKPTNEQVESEFQKMLADRMVQETTFKENPMNETANSVDAENAIESEDRTDTTDSLQTEIPTETHFTPKRISSKQRKESLEAYRETFLQIPKLEDRKPVFISREVRDSLDEIARKLGGRKMSVSGFIENLARHHLEIYRDDVELWKKL